MGFQVDISEIASNTKCLFFSFKLLGLTMYFMVIYDVIAQSEISVWSLQRKEYEL